MNAFVTGGTGLLGSNLVRLLAERGYQVKALVRSRKKAEDILGGLGVEYVKGDMLDVPGFAGALSGVDVLFHTAAYFREYYQRGDAKDMLEQINVRGTVELFRTAHERGVRRSVFTSSSGIIGVKKNGSPGDETTSPHPLIKGNGYFESKAQAEEATREFVGETGADVVTVLPGWMFGPGDAAPTGSGQLVLDFLAGKLPIVLDGGTSVADARDVAAAMISAAERGRAGERYIAGGKFYTVSDISRTLEDVSGVPAPKRRVPYPAMMIMAGASELFGWATGRSVLISRDAVRTMRAGLAVDSSKAARELGATFRPLEETLRDEVAWFEQRGMAAQGPQEEKTLTEARSDNLFPTLEGHKNINLTTFRKSGDAVPTPVWYVVLDGRLYVRTEADSGKAKRIRNNGRVKLAPSTVRGKTVGPTMEGEARVLGPGEENLTGKAMELLGRKYKTTPIVNLLTRGHEWAVLEISPIGT